MISLLGEGSHVYCVHTGRAGRPGRANPATRGFSLGFGTYALRRDVSRERSVAVAAPARPRRTHGRTAGGRAGAGFRSAWGVRGVIRVVHFVRRDSRITMLQASLAGLRQTRHVHIVHDIVTQVAPLSVRTDAADAQR